MVVEKLASKLAPTGAIAAICMGCFPVWTVRAGICRMFALRNPCLASSSRLQVYGEEGCSPNNTFCPSGEVNIRSPLCPTPGTSISR